MKLIAKVAGKKKTGDRNVYLLTRQTITKDFSKKFIEKAYEKTVEANPIFKEALD